ncbi:MAG: DUF5706 domain-containing protein [Desulfobacterales bacterium]|jgi:hypothetical protein
MMSSKADVQVVKDHLQNQTGIAAEKLMGVKEPAGHIDQMLRQTRVHHTQLSQMADIKANMIMTIASLLVPFSIRYLQTPQFHLAALTMIGFCILTVLLSAYAAMPKIGNKKWLQNKAGDRNSSFNLLFFGSFSNLDYPEFKEAMEEAMNDHNQTYEFQIREIYTMGRYLYHRKYRFVRLAYLSFIIGILLSSSIYLGSYYLY